MGKSETMSAIKIALQHNQRRGKRKSGEVSTEVSPDSKCPICLDMFNNISYLDLCLHKFCFRCIHEWSKNKAECPLCKQPFNSIYHSIKSEQDFKKYDLKPADNGSFGTFGGVRFRYRTTLTGVSRQRTIAPPQNGVMFEASTNPAPQRQDRYIRRIMTKLAAQRRAASEGRSVNNLREQEMINFRKELYRQGVRVRGVRDGGRSRDTSAEFYRRNPACLHRLVPWLKRELMVLYGAHGSLVNIVQHIVMSRITRYDVEDGAMLEELRPFLQGCTEHFLHEFISFAKSPFNMEAYDQHAVYDYQGRSSTDENSSNSSVIALSEDEAQSIELDPPGDSSSTNMSHSMWDDETPGPSYSTQTESSRVEQLSLPDSDSDSSVEEDRGLQPPVETVRPLNQKAETPQNECFSSDSEDCVIVGFVKPTAERTPELVQLSSDSSDDEDNKERPGLPQHIRFTSVSPAVSVSSGPADDPISEKETNVPETNVKERHKTSRRTHTPEKRSKETHKDAHRSKNREQRAKRRSRSRDRRTPESYSRDRGHTNCTRDDYYSYYKRRDGHSTHTHSSHSGSHHHYDRDRRHGRYSRSRSRSRERRHDRGRSKSYSSSRSPSVKRKSHHEKPGGKRKYKTRHLEEPCEDSTKHSSSKHRKKSKDKSQDVELDRSENSPERSRRHRKKKKKHKKKSKRHKSSERKEKRASNVITIDSDNCADGTQDNSTHNSPNKTSPDLAETTPLDTEALWG
ncbi:topoisomerase I binding, arginine/serine-rich a [Boleophthalmus pectinirostris]|uniref:topoisomerase I binding, arginine/serine-rich a n=1 Tax=Boleophthalmus pectinirostris TaxID=150288 RepID=UPI00242DC6C1|nr:topoisomerase I binding, arginine/serine-rich a [Boleophthalmus pectinirostris]